MVLNVFYENTLRLFTIYNFIVIIDMKIGGDVMKRILMLLIMIISFSGTVYAESDLTFTVSAPSDAGINDKASIYIAISKFNNTKGDINTCSFKITATNELLRQERVSVLENWAITSSDIENITISTTNSPINSLIESTRLININANISDTTEITISNISCYGTSNQDDPYIADDVFVTISKTQYNTNLKELSTSPVDVSPAFSKDNLRYNVELASNQNSLVINAVSEDSNATVKIMVDGEEQDTTLEISNTETIVSIIVDNNGDTKTYTLNVVKSDDVIEQPSTINTELSKLEINGSSLELKSNVREYSASVPNNVSSTRIVAQLKDSNAKFKENFGSRDVQLNVGSNVFELIVLGTENKETTYKITINRAEPVVIPSSSSIPSSQNPNTAGPLSITFIILFMVVSLYVSIIYYKKYNKV